MIFGYYDRHGYENMYTGPANGGLAPLTDLGQGIGTPIEGSCSLIATQQGFDGRTTRGHVDDYWVEYGESGPDPWETGAWDEHEWGGLCRRFFGIEPVEMGLCWRRRCCRKPMSMDQLSIGMLRMVVPCTTTFLQHRPAPLRTALCHGLRLFAEARGYDVLTNYTQLTDNQNANGFTFDDYMQEIDNDFPVMIHVTGHSMVGVGYDDATQTVFLHDTWDNDIHQMLWGESYLGMTMEAVTVIHLDPDDAINHAPSFASAAYAFATSEDAFEGAYVGMVSATDVDWDQTVNYSIVAGNTDDAFAIDAQGRITVNNRLALDYESASSFTLTVQAADNGSPQSLTDTVTVTISLTDGEEITIAAEADAPVYGGSHSTTNFGASTYHQVRRSVWSEYKGEAYLRFDYSTVTAEVTRAVLKLTPIYVAAGYEDVEFRVRLVDDTGDGWVEDSITWADRPTGSGTYVTFTGSQLTVNEAFELDVTSLLQQASNANGVATFHVDVISATESTTPAVRFASRENETTYWRPQLVFDVASLFPTTLLASQPIDTSVSETLTELASVATALGDSLALEITSHELEREVGRNMMLSDQKENAIHATVQQHQGGVGARLEQEYVDFAFHLAGEHSFRQIRDRIAIGATTEIDVVFDQIGESIEIDVDYLDSRS